MLPSEGADVSASTTVAEMTIADLRARLAAAEADAAALRAEVGAMARAVVALGKQRDAARARVEAEDDTLDMDSFIACLPNYDDELLAFANEKNLETARQQRRVANTFRRMAEIGEEELERRAASRTEQEREHAG